MKAKENLRAVLDPKSVAIVGARGHVTDEVGRVRGARRAPPPAPRLLRNHQVGGASDNPNKKGGNRGPVSGEAARLREAIQRPPDHEARCTGFFNIRTERTRT